MINEFSIDGKPVERIVLNSVYYKLYRRLNKSINFIAIDMISDALDELYQTHLNLFDSAAD